MGSIYPAHAGINPPHPLPHEPRGNLPRTRGDKPTGEELAEDAVKSTPHTRG